MRKLQYDTLGLPKPIVGWIYNHATRNYWRVASWYELDDLVQDGLMIAYKCRERYPDVDPPHFMALVKRSYHNHIGDLLRHSRPEQEVTVHLEDTKKEHDKDTYNHYEANYAETPPQEFLSFIEAMPTTLRDAVKIYLNSPEKLFTKPGLSEGDEKIAESKLLHKLCKFPRRFDFETELRAYLWESEYLSA